MCRKCWQIKRFRVLKVSNFRRRSKTKNWQIHCLISSTSPTSSSTRFHFIFLIGILLFQLLSSYHVYIVNSFVYCCAMRVHRHSWLSMKIKLSFQILLSPLQNFTVSRIRRLKFIRITSIAIKKMSSTPKVRFREKSRVANRNDMSITGNSPIEIRYENKIYSERWLDHHWTWSWSHSLHFFIVFACACETI